MTEKSEQKKQSKAVLVGVQLPNISDKEHQASLDELGRLAKTLGLDVIAQVSQKRKSHASGTILGRGKLNELATWTDGPGIKKDGEEEEEEYLNPYKDPDDDEYEEFYEEYGYEPDEQSDDVQGKSICKMENLTIKMWINSVFNKKLKNNIRVKIDY